MCARLSWMLSFRVHVKLLYRIISYLHCCIVLLSVWCIYRFRYISRTMAKAAVWVNSRLPCLHSAQFTWNISPWRRCRGNTGGSTAMLRCLSVTFGRRRQRWRCIHSEPSSRWWRMKTLKLHSMTVSDTFVLWHLHIICSSVQPVKLLLTPSPSLKLFVLPWHLLLVKAKLHLSDIIFFLY